MPTMRYLRFVLFRARTIHSIIACLPAEGHRLPIPLAPSVLAKIWLAMDIPLNKRRIALPRNHKLWTDKDLYIANLFLVKLDMCFTDPVNGNGEIALRKLMLAQRSLSTLDKVLRREDGRDILEIMALWARVYHRPSEEHRKQGWRVLGVPSAELGMLGVEGWGCKFGQHEKHDVAEDPYLRHWLLRPDQLVLAEASKRKLPLHKRILDMIIYGYVDDSSGQDLPRNERGRQAWMQEERLRGFVRAQATGEDETMH